MAQITSDSDGLPLHRSGRPHYGQKGITFESEGYKNAWSRRWKNLVNRVTAASTGSPSDGLGDATASETSVPALTLSAKEAQGDATTTRAARDESDWIVDEVVVSDDTDNWHHKSDRGTNTGTKRSDTSSIHHFPNDTDDDLYKSGVFAWIRWRAWPAVYVFFDPRFEDADRELEYQKQAWYSNKGFAFYASLYLVLNWVLYIVFNHPSTSPSLFAQIVFYGGLSLVTIPVPFMIAYNFPQHSPITFQIVLAAATWYCGVAEVIQMKQCGFYTHNNCHGKDFLAMNYYITAVPVMMMFIVSRRFYNAVVQVIVLALLLGLIIPDQGVYARNVVSFALFSIFSQARHYAREIMDRRMFMLNTQLKVAYRAQQKAQIAESKASLAKRRFASYIFHEVRVPLNTAMLAFQNMQLNMVFKDVPDQNVEVYALEASLSMMQQVLNDVLDLQKMDAGHFESSPRPFRLHRAIRSMLQPTIVATTARHLGLRIDLDPRIDQLVQTHQPDASDDGLWVIGDELRLRQILTNLASNAVKFTPNGAGEIRVTSKLLEVRAIPKGRDKEKAKADGELDREMGEFESGEKLPTAKNKGLASGSSEKGLDHLATTADEPQNMLSIRLEVHDKGPGIKPSDLVDKRLFQPFVQTNVGILSGTGSGLGLAIVRQIVSLSGGRLGVVSRKGHGAMFWIELSYPIATSTELKQFTPPHTPSTPQKPQPPPIQSVPPPIPPTRTPPLPRYSSQEATDTEKNTPSPSSPPLSPSEALSDPLHVLVVDDDPMTRSLMTRMLTRQGCLVETAENGKQCLDIVTSPTARNYDLISLDNFMPVMTGEQAVRELRRLGRKDLVVGCTGNALTEDQRSYLEAGADHVLTKPIMIKDFKSILDIARQRKLQPTMAEDT